MGVFSKQLMSILIAAAFVTGHAGFADFSNTADTTGDVKAKTSDKYILIQDAKFTLTDIPYHDEQSDLVEAKAIEMAIGQAQAPQTYTLADLELDPVISRKFFTVKAGAQFEVQRVILENDGKRYVRVLFNGRVGMTIALDELESVEYLAEGVQFAAKGKRRGGRSAAGTITSRAGWRIHPINKRFQCHPGMDIAYPIGYPLRASSTGKIVIAGWWKGGYGKYIRIDNMDGTHTSYAHLNAVNVKLEDWVTEGQLIGETGNTTGGRNSSTGPHLHLEDTRDDSPSLVCATLRDEKFGAAGLGKGQSLRPPEEIQSILDGTYAIKKAVLNHINKMFQAVGLTPPPKSAVKMQPTSALPPAAKVAFKTVENPLRPPADLVQKKAEQQSKKAPARVAKKKIATAKSKSVAAPQSSNFHIN